MGIILLRSLSGVYTMENRLHVVAVVGDEYLKNIDKFLTNWPLNEILLVCVNRTLDKIQNNDQDSGRNF